MVSRIQFNFFEKGKKLTGLLWVFLLMLSLWSYTQARLTATSVSPDFIATLFIWGIVYLLLNKKNDDNTTSYSLWLLVSFLGITAFTIKLSVAPIILLALVSLIAFLQKRKMKLVFILFIISAVSITPFIARNIISSGYVVFPSTAIDIAAVDWKFSRDQTNDEKKYIAAFAKQTGVSGKENVIRVQQMKISEWIPGWWKNRSLADKFVLGQLLLSFFCLFIFFKNVATSGNSEKILLVILLTGIVFWFINGPDPRFGFGPVIGFNALIASVIFSEKEI
jgi:hypothetical protein